MLANAVQEISIIRELPFSVDTWGYTSGQPQFLTHAHKDHCQGIEIFAHHVYCTLLTRDLVCNKYPTLASSTVTWTTLDIGQTLELAVDGIIYSVTALDASHCPGACMLLFHSDVFGTVLHTGDARLGPDHVTAVHEALTLLGCDDTGIDLMVVDATFGQETQEFPSCEDALRQLSTLISTSHAPRVYICAEGLGSEDIINHVYKHLGCSMHLPTPCQASTTTPGGVVLPHAHFHTRQLHEERVKEMQILVRHGIIPAQALTSDPTTRVHMTGGRRLKALGMSAVKEGLMVIKLSTQKWCQATRDDEAYEGKKRAAADGLRKWRAVNNNLTRSKPKPDGPVIEDHCHFILWSMHSSRSELAAALCSLQPRAVIPHSGTLDAIHMPPPAQQEQVLTELRGQIRTAWSQRCNVRPKSPDPLAVASCARHDACVLIKVNPSSSGAKRLRAGLFDVQSSSGDDGVCSASLSGPEQLAANCKLGQGGCALQSQGTLSQSGGMCSQSQQGVTEYVPDTPMCEYSRLTSRAMRTCMSTRQFHASVMSTPGMPTGSRTQSMRVESAVAMQQLNSGYTEG